MISLVLEGNNSLSVLNLKIQIHYPIQLFEGKEWVIEASKTNYLKSSQCLITYKLNMCF